MENRKKIDYIPLMLGWSFIFLSIAVRLVVGENVYGNIVDELDGEVLVYIFNALHFGEAVIPEFMNGMAATAMTPAAWGTVIFYKLFSPFHAYLINYLFVEIMAFCGMYLLLEELLHHKWIGVVVSVLFSQLPFYSVYGLSVMGQPWVFYACLRLWRNKNKWYSFIAIAIFGLFSSLILVGYVDCVIVIGVALIMQIKKHPAAKNAWIQVGILIGIYLLLNWNLIQQILMPSELISHKSEFILTYRDFWTSFYTIFKEGHYHVESLHTGLLGWLFGIMVFAVLFFRTYVESVQRQLKTLFALVIVVAAIAAFYGLWNCEMIVNLRKQLDGIFVCFQLDRLYWLNPTMWFMILGYMAWILLHLTERSTWMKICGWLMIIVMFFNIGSTVYENSVMKKNIATIRDANYNDQYISWKEFFSEALFEEIRDYIGIPQQDYRVASLALYPSIPLYNGFYCIDGYSNNYSLEYKHEFRKIIEKEIEKSEWIRSYYDDWGNRCYLFSAELNNKYIFAKDTAVIENLQLSSTALKELNCSYILSGVEVKNFAESGLEFLKSFEHQDSLYKIYLYKVI